MALHIDRKNEQKEIDLNLNAVINDYGGTPLHCTQFGIGRILGEEFECKRFGDGRILFYTEFDDPNFPGGSILLTKEESVHVMTDQESDVKLLERAAMRKQDKAHHMNMLFDEAERSLNNLLMYINELGYEPPGTKFAGFLQNAHHITKNKRVFEVALNGKRCLIPVSELNKFVVTDANHNTTVVCEVAK